ncbi:uncharacterized protein LOC132314009 [Cornus florida]|uniref:uncharacterized protein LOC132314009 n=1 Tax=Cornus florida TaxID=4283 RepID=UPI00289C3ACA|nr:uncharacterized protein LOC132314009 [Cornus florida]
MEQVKRNKKPSSHNPHLVRIINAIHGRPEPSKESVGCQFDSGRIPVRRVLIDPGSSANVMPRDTFYRFEIKPEKVKPTGNPLLGFDGKRVEPIGMVEVEVQAAERVLMKNFVVIEIHPSYNLLMRKGWIHRVQGVPSTLHQVMQCLGPDGTKVIDIHGDQIDHNKPERTTRARIRLDEGEKHELIDFLSRNADVFTWSHSDMLGISPSASCHSLNVNPNAKPIRQRQRRIAPKRNRIIAEEVNRLLDAGFIREVYYLNWLSNVVVVRKKNGKWRVCIDFTNLNKACPKDSFPLPKIDQMVDATIGYERLTFLDVYSGYNQIPMNPTEEEKTSFVTERGTYCYKVMPFRLKNAGATYQRSDQQDFQGSDGEDCRGLH